MTLRQFAKKSFRGAFLIAALPIYLAFRFLCLTSHEDQCFHSFSQFLSLVPGKTGVYLRAAFYSLACPDTSNEISIGFLTILSHRDTTLREGVYIGPQCNIGKCEIGAYTLIGSGVHILSGNKQHNFSTSDMPIQEQGGQFEKISIGEDCWIGNGSIIMKSISEKVIVASGTIVTKGAEPGTIIAGNPAKMIGRR